VEDITWEPRRVAALEPALPPGTTPAGTRGRILREALALFAAHGFAGTSIRRIGAAVGINSATMYAHFPSKEAVLADLIRIGHEELYTRLAVANAAARGPAARVHALVRAHVASHAEYPMLASVANDEIHALDPELVVDALRLRSEARRMLLEALHEGAEAGVFVVDDVILTATALAAMGMRVAQWFGPDQPYTADQVADHHARLALRMLGAEPPKESR
jgi:AcrR family transcriptional regulator